jgi:transcriptional regulator with XRE-family HTH domain
MKPQDFRAWRSYMALSQRQAATELGMSHAMVKLYERGEDYARYTIDAQGRRQPKAIVIPRVVELACFELMRFGLRGRPPIGAELAWRAGKRRPNRGLKIQKARLRRAEADARRK